MKKNLIKSIIIIILAVGILGLLHHILILKSEDGISQLKSFYKQDENSIDVLFLGSSHVYCDIATGILWDEYGMASYDLGGAEAASFSSYYHLKEALKTQRPKVILYEISISALRPADFPPEFWVEDNDYGMKWNENRIELLKANTPDEMYDKLLLPLGPMHGRYNDLSENDFTDVNNSKNYKGFDPRELTTPFETPQVDVNAQPLPISEKNEKYYRMIIELCKEEGIPLILFVSPYVVNSEEEGMYNYMFEIGKAEGLECIDFNRLYDQFGMDFATDMAEELHLNYSGNYKFTKYIGQLIKERYDIPDRRGDVNYSSWEIDAAKQRIERDDWNLIFNRCDENWLSIPSKEGYVSFVLFSQNGNDIDEGKREYFKNFGIDIDSVSENDAYICKNGQVISSSLADGDFRLSTNENNKGLLFMTEDDMGTPKVMLQIESEKNIEDYGNVIFVYNYVLNRYIGAYRF